VIKEAVLLQIKLHSFSWKYDFLVFGDSPVPCILGADFLSFAKMQLDFATSSYTFAFEGSCQYDFEPLDFSSLYSHCFPCPEEVLKQLVAYTSSMSLSEPSKLDQLVLSFPKLFSDQLGSVKGMVCQLDLTDDLPVRSRPYQCSPPCEIVQDLLKKGVVKKSYSQYASPAFLVPKPQGGYQMVVDYRLLNKKVVFHAFPMPSLEHAFAYFQGARVFSILDLNSSYYQIPLSAKSRKAMAFCTTFGLFEFTKLPMGISVGCQVLSRVIDSLFRDLKHKYVYNFMDDLLVYSRFMEEHLGHLKEVFGLEKAGFALNRDKVHLAQSEIKFLGHSLSEKGIQILPERVGAICKFPPSKELESSTSLPRHDWILCEFCERFFKNCRTAPYAETQECCIHVGRIPGESV
jgi:hypothetical protein